MRFTTPIFSKQTIGIFYYVLLFLIFASCKSNIPKMNPNIRVHFNKLAISWNGKDRMLGGMPQLQNTVIKYHEVHAIEKDTTLTFEFVHNFKDHVEVEARISEKNSTILFTLSPNNFHSQKAVDFVGIFFDKIEEMKTGNAFHKYGPVGAWTHPSIVHSETEIEDNDNQFFIWKYEDGTYAACLPLMGKGYVSSIGKYQNAIGVKAYHSMDGHNESDITVLAIAFGSEPSVVIENLYNVSFGMSEQRDSLLKMKQLPAMFSQLGWCSWNSLGHDVSHDSLIEAAKSFQQNKIPVKWMLIDDGWQDVTGRNGKLKSFKPDLSKFPLGLSHTVHMLKQEYGIENVGIWHTLNGYWAGIEPESDLGERYRDVLHAYTDKVTWTEVEPSVFFLPKPEGGEVFYYDWYKYLSEQGIDFVKVDNQLIVEKIGVNKLNYNLCLKALQNNFQESAKTHFNAQVMNCMCLINSVLHHLENSAIVRSSEDYFPENESFTIKAGNEAVHVYNNIMNNVWLKPLAITDFDMFQSHRKHAHYHALARVLHNGPIYITDFVSQHNSELIEKTCLKSGVLLKATCPLLPTNDCLFQPLDSGIFTASSQFENVILLGAWNTTAYFQQKSFNLSEILSEKSGYLVFDWKTRKATIQRFENQIGIHLEGLECAHFLLYEIKHDFVPIGITDKYISASTIEALTLGENKALVHLNTTGHFMAFSKNEIQSVQNENGIQIKFVQTNGILELNTDTKKLEVFFS